MVVVKSDTGATALRQSAIEKDLSGELGTEHNNGYDCDCNCRVTLTVRVTVTVTVRVKVRVKVRVQSLVTVCVTRTLTFMGRIDNMLHATCCNGSNRNSCKLLQKLT